MSQTGVWDCKFDVLLALHTSIEMAIYALVSVFVLSVLISIAPLHMFLVLYFIVVLIVEMVEGWYPQRFNLNFNEKCQSELKLYAEELNDIQQDRAKSKQRLKKKCCVNTEKRLKGREKYERREKESKK